jgi:hypothetical protein
VALSFLLVLIVCVLLMALSDIAQQLIESNRASKVSDVVITFGTYVMVVSGRREGREGPELTLGWRQIVLGLAIIASRRWSVKSALSSIPKGYLPIQRSDVPKVRSPSDRLRVPTSLTLLRWNSPRSISSQMNTTELL